MKIRITGKPEQVRAMVDNMKEYCGLEINYISNEYKQNRKCKESKYVSVYLDVQDFEEEWKRGRVWRLKTKMAIHIQL